MIVSGRQRTFLDMFPVPEFLLLSSTGVVIKDTDTRFVRLKREIFGDGFELAHVSRVDNPKDAVEAGLINKPQDLSVILREFAERNDVHYIKASLPEERSYLFTASVDRTPPENLRDAVAFIVEENVPVSLAESIFDFEIVNKDKSSGEIKLAVSVLPKDVVVSYTELFESAGLVPISFDLESRAIARAVIRKGDGQATLIVNLTTKKTGFYVVEREVVQFSTVLSYGLGSDNTDPNSAEFLKEEMHKVIVFWNTHAEQARNITRIILCGSKGNQANIIGKLMSGSDIPNSPADVWTKMSYSKNQDQKLTLDESLGYASAIGLVLPDVR